jgi:hypothetical protein
VAGSAAAIPERTVLVGDVPRQHRRAGDAEPPHPPPGRAPAVRAVLGRAVLGRAVQRPGTAGLRARPRQLPAWPEAHRASRPTRWTRRPAQRISTAGYRPARPGPQRRTGQAIQHRAGPAVHRTWPEARRIGPAVHRTWPGARRIGPDHPRLRPATGDPNQSARRPTPVEPKTRRRHLRPGCLQRHWFRAGRMVPFPTPPSMMTSGTG